LKQNVKLSCKNEFEHALEENRMEGDLFLESDYAAVDFYKGIVRIKSVS
jgi:hypothetical protein